MNKSTVSIAKTGGYDYDEVYQAVKNCLSLIGGLDNFIKKNDRVLVKINHLSPASKPERGIITHPIFVKAVVENLKESGAEITVGDDIQNGTNDGYELSGIRKICNESRVNLVNLRERGFVEVECKGLILDKLYISKSALEADILVNLPKFKTHSKAVFTGGIKNSYGLIPKGSRSKYHFDYKNIEDFSKVLTDVFSVIIPDLTIIDGIVAMEGEGPASGTLRNLGLIIASRDAVALDAVAARIIGIEPFDILTTKHADERGLGNGNLQNIETVGEEINSVTVTDFNLPSNYSNILVEKMPAFLAKFISRQLDIIPVVIKDLCVGCQECKENCPADVISIIEKRAVINTGKCTHCLCCHEVCRYGAIDTERSFIGRTLYYLARKAENLGVHWTFKR
ncbi:MAG: DUF362 domain-containing protein [Dehalococcoidia bacterium]|jgi:uncharacterized protein (DUF362 family)/Pyruvate/2-oxoacid:ferredoxin oxidoreductase delta subunit